MKKKILIVVHRFPPRHQAGAELYTLRMAKELNKTHEVVVMSTDDNLASRNYTRNSYDFEGLRVVEFTNHRRYREFEESYADPRMEQHFASVLRAVQPDIVHYQHLLHHSVNYPAIAREFGCAGVATLHEYWLLCGRNGQMLQADGTRCLEPGLTKCAPCMANFMWGRRGLDLWMLRGLASVKKVIGVDLKATARKIRLKGHAKETAQIPPEVVEEMERQLLLREARIRDCFDTIDCFIAPSVFLRERFVEYGLDEERIIHNRLGVETESYRRRTRVHREGRPLRIGFLGSIQEIKGLHLLLEALTALEPDSFELRIYGDLHSKPEYVSSLFGKMGSAVQVMGRASPDEIPTILSTFDLLAVPSIWWENSPLVILEAFATGLPAVVSNIGGMAELVEDEVDGLHFEAGNSEDLARKIERIQNEAGLLEKLSERTTTPRSIKDDARFHNLLFDAVLSQIPDEMEES